MCVCACVRACVCVRELLLGALENGCGSSSPGRSISLPSHSPRHPQVATYSYDLQQQPQASGALQQRTLPCLLLPVAVGLVPALLRMMGSGQRMPKPSPLSLLFYYTGLSLAPLPLG